MNHADGESNQLKRWLNFLLKKCKVLQMKNTHTMKGITKTMYKPGNSSQTSHSPGVLLYLLLIWLLLPNMSSTIYNIQEYISVK